MSKRRSSASSPPTVKKLKKAKRGTPNANKKRNVDDGEAECEEPCEADDDCVKASKCKLVAYRDGCCKGYTPHHLIEVHCFTESGGRRSKERIEGFEDYNDRLAPCVCVDGSRYAKEHGSMHAIQNMAELGLMDAEGERSQMGGQDGDSWTYGQAKRAALVAHAETFPDSGPGGKPCASDCLAKQLDAYHNGIGVEDDTVLRADRSPLKQEQKDFGAEVLEALEESPGGKPARTPKRKRG